MTNGLDDVTDEQLLEYLTRTDTAALDELYSRYGRAAFALAYRVLNDPEGAEDAVQEAFLTVWRRAGSYRPERGTVRAWLLTVVRNRAIDQIRAQASRPRGTAALEELERLAASDGDPAEAALRGADAAAIQGALAKLPEEQREAVQLAFFHGLTYVEVSARTGAPLGTVKSRMRLALERMRGLLLAGNTEHELRGH